MAFQKVATLEDLWSGEIMGVEINGVPILLANVDGHIYAYADSCPHQNSRLTEGTLAGKVLRCARHHWEFDVCSGSGVNPENACLRAFPITLRGDDILVDVDSVLPPGAAIEGER